ncbi:MAG: L,D-transpeptidase family protein [Gaiellaceae bacterium]|nr:L,D-transpeptidase family protein [Gaiellaceae bacterium]
MRGHVVLLVALGAAALAPAAAAAPPTVAVSATPASGTAPLRVSLTATGDAASYSWDLGDGATAAGPVVSHVYGRGEWTATVTATAASGETAQAQVVVAARGPVLTLTAPKRAEYASAVTLTGSLAPARAGARVQIYRGRTHVTTAVTGTGGRYSARIRLRSPGPYRATHGGTASPERAITVRPRLVTAVPTAIAVGSPTSVTARLVPAAAGDLVVRVRSGPRVVAQRRGRGLVRVKLPGARPGTLKIEVVSQPRRGFAAVRRSTLARVVRPALAAGSRGPGVLALERRLHELRYALRGVDTVYSTDTVEAVLAFQKVHGLPRTGRVGASLWRRLAVATVPEPRYGRGDHLEVDKSANVLYEIKGGRVNRIVHVSTGATGNTPLGTFQVYRTVRGWDWVLWYPMYFLRGFAIHGYPSVPAYPASHGCVRVPMWIAPELLAQHGHGARVVVHA